MVINYRPVIKALGIEEGAFTRAVSEADSILKYTESKISGRNFWQVSPDELRFIYSISVNLKARNVVETGVGPGTTSYAFLTALKQTGGKLTSFDLGVVIEDGLTLYHAGDTGVFKDMELIHDILKPTISHIN